MKKSFNKVLSLVLTVCMMLGTIAMVIPATLFSASAAVATTVEVSVNGGAVTSETLPYTLPNNANVTVNGVTMRLDPHGDHTDTAKSRAVIKANGSIELRLRGGDVFWLPGATLSNSSVYETNVTYTGNNCGGSEFNLTDYDSLHSFGSAWNVVPASGGWSATPADSKMSMAAVRATATSNNEATGTTLSILNQTCKDGRDGVYAVTSAAGLADQAAAVSAVFGAAVDAGPNGAFDETVITTVSYDNGVKAVLKDAYNTTLATVTYTGSEAPLTGAVGFAMCWGKWDSTYVYTLNDLTVTNGTIGGVATENFSLRETVLPGSANLDTRATYTIDFTQISGTIYLEPNKVNMIGGHPVLYIKNSGNGSARVENGKLLMDGYSSDMLLFLDCFVDGYTLRTDVYMKYTSDPGNGWFGSMVRLSDELKGTISMATPNKFGAGHAVYGSDFSYIYFDGFVKGDNQYAPGFSGAGNNWTQYTSGQLAVNTPFVLSTTGNGLGSGVFDPTTGNRLYGSWGNNHSTKETTGLTGLVFSGVHSGSSPYKFGVAVDKVVVTASSSTLFDKTSIVKPAAEALNRGVAFQMDNNSITFNSTSRTSWAYKGTDGCLYVKMKDGDSIAVPNGTDFTATNLIGSGTIAWATDSTTTISCSGSITVAKIELDLPAPAVYNYTEDFSTIDDMTLVPGYNNVNGHLWYYMRSSDDGSAYVKDHVLYVNGSSNDMILFADLATGSGTPIETHLTMQYLNDPGSGYFGFISHLQNSQNGSAEEGTVRYGHLMALGKDSWKGKMNAYTPEDFSEYGNRFHYELNEASSKEVELNTDIAITFWCGVEGKGGGKLCAYAPGYGWGNQYASSTDYQDGPMGLVFGMNRAADNTRVSVCVKSIDVTYTASESETDIGVFPAQAVFGASSEGTVTSLGGKDYKFTSDNKYSYAYLNSKNQIVLSMNPGDVFKVTGLKSADVTRVSGTGSSVVNATKGTLSCKNYGATFIISGLNGVAISVGTPATEAVAEASLTLEGTVQLNVRVSGITALDAYNSRFVIEKNTGDEGAFEEYTDSLIAATQAANGEYILQLPVPAKELNTASYRVTVEGIAGLTAPYVLSVSDYAAALADEQPEYADLMDTMETYGSAAEMFFSEEEVDVSELKAELAGTTVEEEVKGGKNPESVDFNVMLDGFSMSLVLRDCTDMYLYFKVKSTVEGVYAMVDEEDVELAYETSDPTVATLAIKNIAANELSLVRHIQLVDNLENVIDLNLSALTWADQVINTAGVSDQLLVLAQSLVRYSASADNVFNA